MVKIRQKYLQRVYAFLLLAVMALSVIPVKLMHRHEGERPPLSQDFAGTEHFAAGHQPFCPICSCTFTQYYLPAKVYKSFVHSFPVSHTATLPGVYVHGKLDRKSTRLNSSH